MGQDWPNGDEPACGDFIGRVMMWVAAIVLIIATMLLGGCEPRKCNEGATREDSNRENTYYVCQNNEWVRYTNPDKPDHRTDA